MIDITVARLTHIEWTLQLELALQKRNLVIDLRAYNECELGIWLYGIALGMYEDIPEIKLLEQEHKLFHIAAEKVAKWHNSPNLSARHDAQAQVDFDEVKIRSKEIVYILTMLEFKMLDQYRNKAKSVDLRDFLMHPLKTLSNINKGSRNTSSIYRLSLEELRNDLRDKY
jgi:hypothetical protein